MGGGLAVRGHRSAAHRARSDGRVVRRPPRRRRARGRADIFSSRRRRGHSSRRRRGHYIPRTGRDAAAGRHGDILTFSRRDRTRRRRRGLSQRTVYSPRPSPGSGLFSRSSSRVCGASPPPRVAATPRGGGRERARRVASARGRSASPRTILLAGRGVAADDPARGLRRRRERARRRSASPRARPWTLQRDRVAPRRLEAMGAASFGVWIVYLLGEVGAVGVQALASEAEGAGDRSAGVGRAVGQGLYFSALAAAAAAVLAAPRCLNAYLDVLNCYDPLVRRHATAYRDPARIFLRRKSRRRRDVFRRGHSVETSGGGGGASGYAVPTAAKRADAGESSGRRPQVPRRDGALGRAAALRGRRGLCGVQGPRRHASRAPDLVRDGLAELRSQRPVHPEVGRRGRGARDVGLRVRGDARRARAARGAARPGL